MVKSRTAKACMVCGVEKELAEYPICSRNKDGLDNFCKVCKREKSRIYRAKNRENRNKSNRQYRKQNRVNRWKYLKGWRDKHPEKHAAHIAVKNALKDGSLKKKKCPVCGAEKVEAHHYDYSKPLDVVWLCKKHHRYTHEVMLIVEKICVEREGE